MLYHLPRVKYVSTGSPGCVEVALVAEAVVDEVVVVEAADVVSRDVVELDGALATSPFDVVDEDLDPTTPPAVPPATTRIIATRTKNHLIGIPHTIDRKSVV